MVFDEGANICKHDSFTTQLNPEDTCGSLSVGTIDEIKALFGTTFNMVCAADNLLLHSDGQTYARSTEMNTNGCYAFMCIIPDGNEKNSFLFTQGVYRSLIFCCVPTASCAAAEKNFQKRGENKNGQIQ